MDDLEEEEEEVEDAEGRYKEGAENAIDNAAQEHISSASEYKYA